jgi:hypothetical protein
MSASTRATRYRLPTTPMSSTRNTVLAEQTEARIIPSANETTLLPVEGVPTFAGKEKDYYRMNRQSRSVTQILTL